MITLLPISFERVVDAVEVVRQRLFRATAALDASGVPYAVAGGNAVAVWVARVDRAAVRATQDVDILIRRQDLPATKTALEAVGFVYRHVAGIDVFLDGANAKPRDGVHLVFAGEKVRPHEPAANPDVEDSEAGKDFRLLTLEALVRVKLTAFRRKDQVHIQDMIGVGLIDQSWTGRLPPVLAERLQELLDDPTG